MPRDIEKQRERDREHSAEYRRKHPEQVKAALRKYMEAHREERREDSRRWRKEHPAEVRANNAKYRREIKAAAFRAYGGALCVCCGETETAFLSIDHINGGGNKHRRAIMAGKAGGGQLYYWLKKNHYPLGFRVLCLNCNFAIGHFGLCPHQSATPGSEWLPSAPQPGLA